MTSSMEKLGQLWEQAITDENWDLAAEYQEQLRHNSPAMTPEVQQLAGVQEQRAILSAELYWFGGIANHGKAQTHGPRDIM